MEFFETVNKRISCRKFKDQEIPKDILMKILDAGNKAPSAMNQQPWEFIIVKDKKLKHKIREIYEEARDKKGFYQQDTSFVEKGTQIFVVSDKTKHRHIISASLAIENILLAATDLGLGSIVMTALISFEEHVKEIRGLLKVPDKFDIIALVVVGYKDEESVPKKKRKLKGMIHYDKF